MSDTDRRGAPSRDYADWKAALEAVDRLAAVRATLREPVDEAQLKSDIAEIRKAARRLETPDPKARKRLIAWMLFGAVWIATAIMTAGSIGAILYLLT